MWLIALVLGAAAVGMLALSLQRSREDVAVARGGCPRCETPLEPLAPEQPEDQRHWEVLACPTCADLAVVCVQGIPARAGWCPRCQQHALELRARRLPAQPGRPLRAVVDELCHLCHHEQAVHVSADPFGQPGGKVLEFPAGGRRR